MQLLFFNAVLIVPKILLRFEVPAGISALIIGMMGTYFFDFLLDDKIFYFLSIVGITSLFLFSGLEVNIGELRKSKKELIRHVAYFVASVSAIGACLYFLFDTSLQAALIFSLGIFTPSAGFIISSMGSLDMKDKEEGWIKTRAISKEFFAIIFLFIVLLLDKPQQLLVSCALFILFFICLPYIFKFYFKVIDPYAKHAVVPFLVAISFTAGVISKALGAYYLVGAFLVGVVGSMFLHKVSDQEEKKLLNSLSAFFSVFLPFYFFYSGVKLSVEKLTVEAFAIAVVLYLIFVPARFLFTKYFHPETSVRVSVVMLPTLVFGLVIGGILSQKNLIEDKYIYALIIYTVLTSITPIIMTRIKQIRGVSDVN